MGQISDLVRSLRAQPQRVDLTQATAVLERARAEGVAPEELHELQTLLTELKDKFAPEVRESLTAFVDGAGDARARPVHELVPELAHVQTLDEVIERFGADFTLLRGQLIGAKGLSGADKAARVFEFLLAYAEQFVNVANGDVKAPTTAPVEVVDGGLFGGRPTGTSGDAEIAAGKVKLPPIPPGDPGRLPTPDPPAPVPREERSEKIRAFAQALQDSGFTELKDARTGRDAVAIAAQLLSARNLRELQSRANAVRLQPPASWNRDESAAMAAANTRSATASAIRGVPREVTDALAAASARDRARPDVDRLGGAGKLDAMRVQPWQTEAGRQVVVQPAQRDARRAIEEPPRSARGTNKVLGRNMLWNVLHTYREGPDGEPEEKLATDRLAFGAILLLVAIAAVAILIVTVA